MSDRWPDTLEGVADTGEGDDGPGGTPVNSTSLQLEASRVIKSGPGLLCGFTGYNSGPAQFVQLHDAQQLPADTAVPVVIVAVPAASNFSLDYTNSPRVFVRGIIVCNSTTAATKTIGAANCWFDAQYF